MVRKIINVQFHTDKSGSMVITGMRDSGYPFEITISQSNPLSSISITNEYFIFRTKQKQAEYIVYFRDVDMTHVGAPTRKLDWSGCDKPAPTSMIYLIHDIISEVKYFCYVKKYLNADIQLEVEYLKERYRDCEKFISDFDFEVMVNELIRRFEAVHGVPQQ